MNKYVKISIYILIVVLSMALLASCGNNEEDKGSEQEKEEKGNESSLTESNRNTIISTVKDFVAEQENQVTIQFPEEGQDYQIEKNDEQEQLIISGFTGRAYENVYFVSGNFILDDKDYNFEMVLSLGDVDSNEPTLIKYSSGTDTYLKLDEAQIYLVEEDEFKEL
ncbi:hypothetical protein D8M04_17925 [Oceanobacillus piezotolerans]|uniref:Lipoprotein n=1 Tax=Oceanobacillus piezotolerans TaxID=2448030 RepID=A0A498D1W8_9BACI|nr:hypothetical protein [Oceanobacillus piezotolerans]RLL41121.1 hypothetical protein D8M04_17925 [Oceanobacillus piezotolerans]